MTTRVTISYDPDLSKIGETVDVDDDEAVALISSGRAVPAEKGKRVSKDAEPPTPVESGNPVSVIDDSKVVETKTTDRAKS